MVDMQRFIKMQQLHQVIVSVINNKGKDEVNKDKLLTWVEDIRPKFQGMQANDGFIINYTAHFLMQSISASNQVMERITIFLSDNDRWNSEPIFHTDVLNKEKIDLHLQINLEEQSNFIEVANQEEECEDCWLINGIKYNLVPKGFDMINEDNIREFDDIKYPDLNG